MDRRLPVERIERYDSEDGIHVKKWTVGEFVRCKDCEHYKQSEADPSRKMCWRKDVDGFPVCYDFCPTDYCSYGERRENE